MAAHTRRGALLTPHRLPKALSDDSRAQMTEPPKRLRAACDKYGISRDEFGVTDIGETVRIKVERPQR